MTEPPNYSAISYAWVEEVFPYELHLPGGHLRITRSLYGALRSFRSRDVTVRLWADQVCIAQYDLAEKNHQVENVATIYRKAEEVLVWLGESRESDCSAYSTLRFLTDFQKDERGRISIVDLVKIASLPAAFEAYKSDTVYGTSHGPQCCVNTPPLIDLEQSLRSLTDAVWSRPWFDRLWVVQEVAVGPIVTLRFGSHTLKFEHLFHAADTHLGAFRA